MHIHACDHVGYCKALTGYTDSRSSSTEHNQGNLISAYELCTFKTHKIVLIAWFYDTYLQQSEDGAFTTNFKTSMLRIAERAHFSEAVKSAEQVPSVNVALETMSILVYNVIQSNMMISVRL